MEIVLGKEGKRCDPSSLRIPPAQSGRKSCAAPLMSVAMRVKAAAAAAALAEAVQRSSTAPILTEKKSSESSMKAFAAAWCDEKRVQRQSVENFCRKLYKNAQKSEKITEKSRKTVEMIDKKVI